MINIDQYYKQCVCTGIKKLC